MICQFSKNDSMIFSLAWNTMFTNYWKVLALKFWEMVYMVFFGQKKLMQIWYLLSILELFIIFQDLGNIVFCAVMGWNSNIKCRRSIVKNIAIIVWRTWLKLYLNKTSSIKWTSHSLYKYILFLHKYIYIYPILINKFNKSGWFLIQ